ncbi:MAG: DNA repair exonuclease, partial [Pseudomonadota bacterium]|nr:DNA repair exonuclease [Pseudomonadota bacterium]
AGLDYLALGDWHGQVRVDARTWYSGAPEPDRFLHRAPGRALVVSLPGPGAEPEVRPVETGEFGWETAELALLPGEDPAARLAALLPDPARRRRTLLRLVATGRARLPERAALLEAVGHAAPDFAFAEIRAEALALEPEAADLDAIDRAGALRDAAEALLAEAADPALPDADRAAAAAALARLHAYALEETGDVAGGASGGAAP